MSSSAPIVTDEVLTEIVSEIARLDASGVSLFDLASLYGFTPDEMAEMQMMPMYIESYRAHKQEIMKRQVSIAENVDKIHERGLRTILTSLEHAPDDADLALRAVGMVQRGKSRMASPAEEESLRDVRTADTIVVRLPAHVLPRMINVTPQQLDEELAARSDMTKKTGMSGTSDLKRFMGIAVEQNLQEAVERAGQTLDLQAAQTSAPAVQPAKGVADIPDIL